MSQELTAGLVRRHIHDLRNFLNGAEMSLTLLSETQDDAERQQALQRIREEMKVAEVLLRGFGAKFGSETKQPLSASDLFEQWMVDARALLPDTVILWKMDTSDSVLELDPNVLRSALCDVLLMVARKNPDQPLTIQAQPHGQKLIISVSGNRPFAPGPPDSGDQSIWSWLEGVAVRNNGTVERVKGAIQLTLPIAKL